MKTKYLLLGAIFAISSLVAHGQMFEMYYQGFEAGETVNYTGTPTGYVRYSTPIHMGGNRSVKLVQSTTDEVELILDTLDFTTNTTLRYIALRFDHICRIQPNPGENYMAKLYYKRANQTTWSEMTGQEYNRTGDSFSPNFEYTSAFTENSYGDDWWHDNVPSVSNDQWRSERFDLDNVMTSSVPTNERKLLIKFVLRHRASGLTTPLDTVNMAWWIDNIRVTASSERMLTPRITMTDYPYMEFYPNSRGAHIALKATTNVAAGINPDSVYLFYTIGSDLATHHRLAMTPVTGSANEYECRIPFCGYDTLMRFYCVARDATSNANMVTFPRTDDTWVEYRAVRGPTEQPGIQMPGFIGNVSSTAASFPFPAEADLKCEFVYDSALMVDAGYGPGGITAMRFTVGTNINTPRTYPRFQIKMRNVPGDYHVDLVDYADYYFTSDVMSVVYDSVLNIPVLSAGLDFTINLQDTFYYTGQGIVVQVTYDCNTDFSTYAGMKMISAPESLLSIFTDGLEATFGFNPFTSTAEVFEKTQVGAQTRPAVVFTEHKLIPLRHDVGISQLVDPNFTVPMTNRPGSLTVKLENFGTDPVNAVRISYLIDDDLTGYFDWTGNLMGGANVNVVISNSINIPAGFHTLCVWVEDTVTAGGVQYRDHEPYNDTSCTQFVVCDGPMGGIKTIGGPSASFNTIEEFLFSVSRCGINDSLIVRLAPGAYPSFTMPVVPGLTAEHYIVFESMGNNRAVLFAEDTAQNSIVNLESVSHMYFRNIDFVRRDGAITDMVTLGINTTDCHFRGCAFLDSLANAPTSMRINAYINTGYANNIEVDSCTFIGGNIGIDVKGVAPDGHSSGIAIRKCFFNNQFTNAIKVEYMDNVSIVDNEIYDVMSNSGSVVQLNGCEGATSVERNKIYTSHGASGLAINDVNGTSTNRILIANNMIVCEDDATANLLRTPFNIIMTNYVDVVFNSVKMVAPERTNVAAATFGGGGINNSRFINNIVASLSTTNYALGYLPTTGEGNEVSHNVYFSNGYVLNRRGTSSYTSLDAWVAAMPDDTLSISVNPNFLNGSLVDLRTYNRAIKGVALPLPTVTTDLYGATRGDSITCPGAFEFTSLPYDFEPEALLNPSADNCSMPSQVELVVLLRNTGINPFDSTCTTPLTLYYKVNNNAVQSYNITRTVPAEDTAIIHTGAMLSLPPSGINDAVYTIRVWNAYADDPNKTNDTNVFTVVSRYHPAAPGDDSVFVDYSETATITPTVGINSWSVYTPASAPKPKSQIYWYMDSTDTEPFYVGPSYTTAPVIDEGYYYIRQRRSLPIVRITQIEIRHNNFAAGVTNPMPYWMLDARKIAIQITNIGDAPAHLEGDTIMSVSPTSGINNKVYTFPNVTLAPGKSLVLQFVNNGVSDSSLTLRTGITSNYSWNSNVAFIYKHNGAIEDAIPINTILSTPAWTNQSVPSYVWNGESLMFADSTAGIIRTGFAGNISDWELSTATNPMSIDKVNSSWIKYVDNGCEGDIARIAVRLNEQPSVDLEVSEVILPSNSCYLTANEDVSVFLRNYGIDSVNNVVIHYSTGADTVTDTIMGALVPHGDTTYTFNTKLNLLFPHDTTLTVKVWVDSVSGDPVILNDTNEAVITAMFTPGMPDTIADRVVPYATRDTISVAVVPGVVPVWYDYNLNPVDTGYTHITELLYAVGTRGMAYMAANSSTAQVGTGLNTNANTAYPSPYQPSSKFVKQQYIYSASELTAAGVLPGYIASLSFYLESMLGGVTSISFRDYNIAVGLVEDTIFATTASWKDAATVVFHQDTFTLLQSQQGGWVDHVITPFVWDGVSSIVVQVSYEVDAAITTGVKTRYTAKPNTTLHKNANAALVPSTIGFIGVGTKGNNRPNIQFASTVYGCLGPMTTFNVDLSNMPAYDAAMAWAIDFDTIVYTSCDTIDFPVEIRNQGSLDIDSMTIYYYLDNQQVDSTVINDTLGAGLSYVRTFLSTSLAPGRHVITAIVNTFGDSIASNDTVQSMITVRFCGGVYTIGPASSYDYQTFGAAVDTLNQVGILGPVTFNVAEGVYNEQVVLNYVNGSSPTNLLSFIGLTDSVYLTASTSQTANYVMNIDGASNVRLYNIKMVARPVQNNVNYANVLVMANDSNISIENSYFKVKGTIINSNASCIVLQGNVAALSLTGCVTDSGYYAFKTTGLINNYSNFHFTNNTFRNFSSGGLNIRGINLFNFTHNEIRSGNSADNRGLIGLYIAETTDSVVIEKNKIYLVDERKGAKRGIQLENVLGTSINPVLVFNNMISSSGTDSKGLTPAKSAGIWIDSSSSYINVYYNSVRVRGANVATTANNDISYGFWCGNTPSNIQVMNNIFANFGYGYAYYVSELNTVTLSNYNAYYANNTKTLAWKLTDFSTLAQMQNQNGDDANSYFEEPYFIANTDLHLTMTNFATKAQYNTDVPDDIDGNQRPQIPAPTIGAHEKDRLPHDMAVVRIHNPQMPVNINEPLNIESDSILVEASFHNNGLSNETNVTWYAEVVGYESQTRSPIKSLGNFAPAQMKRDSVRIPAFLGLTDTQNIHVVVIANGDASPADNEKTELFYLAPAFNLAATKVEVSNDYVPAGCRMNNASVRITLKNDGSKPFPAGSSIKIGYHTEITQPADLVIPTLPDTVEQMVTLTNILPIGSTIFFDFTQPANLYPTGTYTDIKVRVKGWCNYQYDVHPNNDSTGMQTSQSPIVDSYFTPAPPDGHDTTLAYGTWGEVTAEQENLRPIRWFRDSTAAPFFTGNNYNLSCRWTNTPQYFHDSVYYLNCISTKNCPSYFSPVTVSVAARKARDMAMEAILAPLGNRVYMQNDTVRVRVANYGTTPQSNIPIVYEFKQGNNVLQSVRDTIWTAIAPGDTHIHTFATLLDVPSTLTAATYTVNVWTDLTNDATRRNDTIRIPTTIASLPQTLYNNFSGNIPSADDTKFDITRVSFNGIDFNIPPLNRSYTNLADFSDPDYPVLHVKRGTTDSIFIDITEMHIDPAAEHFRCRATVGIDFDRSGLFGDNASCNELIADGSVFYSDSTFATLVTIPECASYGYMRMRVKVMEYDDNATTGHIIDFLLIVDESGPVQDIGVTQIVAPRSPIIRDDLPVTISFRVINRGEAPVTSADFHYLISNDQISTGVVNWTGSIAPGTSTVVSLPPYVFPMGTSSVAIWHNTLGDEYPSNDSIFTEYHNFYMTQPTFLDSFDIDDNWYAPRGFNDYTRNFWQRGMPNKARLDTTYSGEFAWVTDLNNTIVTGKRGSVSYLYSPIINIAQVRTDTISFRLRRNLTAGSSLHVEYYNYARKWIRLEDDSCLTWYNDIENHCFTGTTSNSESYTRVAMSTRYMNSDFQEKAQFRLVYSTPVGFGTSSSYGEGCAVDNFRVGRAPRGVDAGVVDITKPEAPQYGNTIFPEVVVKNYGTDTLRFIRVGYTHFSNYLPKEEDFECAIGPNCTDTFQLHNSFVITNQYPDSFYINAFTIRADDIYMDNDTTDKLFHLLPLDRDIVADSIISPLRNVVAGDTAVNVTFRIRNGGFTEISSATVSYIINNLTRVDETIDFEELLGRPLQSLEYYNYTFHQKIHAPMGLMNIVAIVKSPVNDYIYNDTVSKRVEGIMSVTDLAVTSVVLDTSDHVHRYVGLVIENVGARGANGFQVGYYYDNDTTTKVIETYSRQHPLAALTTGYYVFNTELADRPAPYQYLRGFVNVEGDNDPSNDTCNYPSMQYVDLEVIKVVIEENANPDCRVFLQVRNIGNIAILGRPIKMRAAINGDSIITNLIDWRIDPGQTIHLEFNRRIPKSPTRHYVGTGWVDRTPGDNNPVNDMTSIVEVINYFEGVPTVNGDQMVLEQNYPNPFTQQTTIPFTLPNAAHVKFFVMDAMGHIVHRDEQNYQAGSHLITIDMQAYAAGVYYYGIEVDGQRQMRKMILR